VPRTLLRPGWVALHLLTLVVVVAFLRLGWWQLTRAQDGNALSIGYAFEWPVFAVFTVGVWLWLCRDALRRERPVAPASEAASPQRVPDAVVLPVVGTAAVDDGSNPELTAYNRMLARLNERPRR